MIFTRDSVKEIDTFNQPGIKGAGRAINAFPDGLIRVIPLDFPPEFVCPMMSIAPEYHIAPQARYQRFDTYRFGCFDA